MLVKVGLGDILSIGKAVFCLENLSGPSEEMLCSNPRISFRSHFHPSTVMEDGSVSAKRAGVKCNFSKTGTHSTGCCGTTAS